MDEEEEEQPSEYDISANFAEVNNKSLRKCVASNRPRPGNCSFRPAVHNYGYRSYGGIPLVVGQTLIKALRKDC